jgi:hypothetical protein
MVGKSIKSYSVDTNGDTLPLISIPKWDFHWQGFYNFRKVTKITTGSTLWAEAVYDNTVNNPSNPNNPPQWVFAGEGTSDEMMLVYFAWTYYLPGDENIILDSSSVLGIENPSNIISTAQLYEPYPSPAEDFVTVDFYLPESETVSIELYDITGSLISSPVHEQNFSAGLNSQQIYIKQFSSGVYLVKLKSANIIRSKKLIKE